jgi:hypothetical protein
MMPGTANSFLDHQTLRERTVVVAAIGINRYDLRAELNKHNVVVADMAEQFAVAEVGRRDAKTKIRPRWFLLVAHRGSLSSAEAPRHLGLDDSCPEKFPEQHPQAQGICEYDRPY